MGTQKQYHERTLFSLKVNAEEGNAKDKWHLFLYKLVVIVNFYFPPTNNLPLGEFYSFFLFHLNE